MERVRQLILTLKSERWMKIMFAYVEIIDSEEKVSYGYSNFSFSKGVLSIRPIKGMLGTSTQNIPIKEITNIKEDTYYGWNRISFNFANKTYSFLYSGYGEFDYLKEHLMAEIMA